MDEEAQKALDEIRQQLETNLRDIVGQPNDSRLMESMRNQVAATLQRVHDGGPLQPTVFARRHPDDPNVLQMIALMSDLSRHRVLHRGEEHRILSVDETNETLLLDNQQRCSVWDPTYEIVWIPWPITRFRVGRIIPRVLTTLQQCFWELFGRNDSREPPTVARLKNTRVRSFECVEQQVSETVREQVKHKIMDPVSQLIDHGWR